MCSLFVNKTKSYQRRSGGGVVLILGLFTSKLFMVAIYNRPRFFFIFCDFLAYIRPNKYTFKKYLTAFDYTYLRLRREKNYCYKNIYLQNNFRS